MSIYLFCWFNCRWLFFFFYYYYFPYQNNPNHERTLHPAIHFIHIRDYVPTADHWYVRNNNRINNVFTYHKYPNSCSAWYLVLSLIQNFNRAFEISLRGHWFDLRLLLTKKKKRKRKIHVACGYTWSCSTRYLKISTHWQSRSVEYTFSRFPSETTTTKHL